MTLYKPTDKWIEDEIIVPNYGAIKKTETLDLAGLVESWLRSRGYIVLEESDRAGYKFNSQTEKTGPTELHPSPSIGDQYDPNVDPSSVPHLPTGIPSVESNPVPPPVAVDPTGITPANVVPVAPAITQQTQPTTPSSEEDKDGSQKLLDFLNTTDPAAISSIPGIGQKTSEAIAAARPLTQEKVAELLNERQKDAAEKWVASQNH